MYGGDEVNAIVVDVGSRSAKAGFAGEGAPKIVVPTAAAPRPPAGAGAAAAGAPRFHVGEAARYRRDGVDVTYPVEHGLVSDWDAMEELWQHMFRDRLRVETAEHPVMLADPVHNTLERRENMLELVFEKHRHPAAYLGRAPMLAAFSVGKATAMVLEVGAGHCSATPVHDGYVLHKAARVSKFGGGLLDEVLDAMLFELNPATRAVVPRPVYRARLDGVPPGTTASYERHMRLDLLRDIKESTCRVAEEPFDLELNRSIPPVQYELPDGQTLNIGTDRFSLGEKLFVPGDFELKDDFMEFQGVSRLVNDSVHACDADLRRDLLGNVVLSGGVTLLPGFSERLARDLVESSPPALKPKLALPATLTERRFAAWIGGSILASLGSFHQIWLSRAEYEEQGFSALARKCP